jgi:phosphoglycolate phosphatase
MEMIRGLENPLELGTIIFDFDGTLAHLNIDFGEMKRQVLLLFPEFGLDPTLAEGTYVLEGIGAAVEVLKAQGRKGIAAGFSCRAEEILLSIEAEAARESFLLDGIPQTLRDLKARGLHLGIITRNSGQAVRSILERDSLTYDVLLSREDVGRARVKPNPEHLQEALQILRGTPPTCLMVGDHPLDIQVAKRVGAHSAGVLTGRHRARDFEEAGADLILESVKELPSLFDRSSLRTKA